MFAAFFEKSIRVLFNWDRFNKEGWKVELSLVEDRRELSNWYVPWYLGQDKEEINHSAATAQPLLLSDIPENLIFLNEDRKKLIFALLDSFKVSRQPLQMFVPVYDLGGQCLLLDGNHRMAALVLSDTPFKLLTFTVFGPMDSSVLPDLRHWIKAT